VAAVLETWRPVRCLTGPATLDGGDVLRLGRTLYVGVGGRTSDAGAEQLAGVVQPHGYEVRTVRARDCLHLKSAVTEVLPGTILINPAWIDRTCFANHDAIEVDPAEPLAANVLRLGTTVLAAAAFPRTAARLERAGVAVRSVDVSELAKAEGALTCCSLLVS
jgi:dimethylargininase